MEDMEIPEFLQNYNEDDIHEEIFALIPDEYDKSEGQHYWNFTRPTANVVSRLRGYDLPEAIKLIWPRFCYGEYLDFHAELRGIKRKAAQYATGEVTITGTPGTVIPVGYTMATESKNDIASKDYVTTEECTIGEDGTITVPARAYNAGAEGNTASETIIVNSSSFEDVTAIINNEPFIGGINEEDDESLYERIYEYDSTQGDSNVGNPSDYKRWAESIPGTGTANVIRPTDTSGLVTIILTDGNGEPATEDICNAVYDYIMSPNDDTKRLAPCGATLSVIPPTTEMFTITATVELLSGTTSTVTAEFVAAIKEYFPTAISYKKVLYQKIANILGDIPSVYDFSNLKVNGGTSNIALEDGVFPTIDASHITLTLLTD